MPAIETVSSATQTNTDVDNDTLNPTQTEEGAQVQVTLTFVGGQQFVPDALYDALDAQWGTVRTNKVNARGEYSFIISP